MKKPLNFKISSALKNIIGSDLIPDDYIAIFELVKNSYDAHATKVQIIFSDLSTDNAKITIIDNGKGMNYDDLIEKWLFVAYSAKREGTEDEDYDYRDKIKVKRAYAGAKGIGRFSCDKLGNELYLETIKDEDRAKVETLLTYWDRFEGDLKDEFIDIDVLHETIEKSSYDLEHGTVLEISNLKSKWDRSKLLTLKGALAKLINPNTQLVDDQFTIELVAPDEALLDRGEENYGKIVNGEIKNLIFETLNLKTTKLTSKVLSQDEGIVETSLLEGGRVVYSIVEKNRFDHLHNVSCEVYYLNRSAKATFSRRMGLQPVEYGHIFVYKNGLRIYPYGERGEDPLKMDNRKTQGRTRYLGTREVIGYISIDETEESKNDDLRETSSRGDGLIKTPAYFELVDWFYSNLKKIERYIIDVVDWGNFLSKDDFINFNKYFIKGDEKRDVNDNIIKLIASLSNANDLVEIQVSENIYEILERKGRNSASATLKKIKDKIIEGEFTTSEVLRELDEAGKKIDQLRRAKDEAEDEAYDKLIENESLTSNLEEERKKGAFQGALIGTDKERIISLQHQVFHSSSRIHRNIKLLIKHLGGKDIDAKTRKYIKVVSLEASKINSIANFITKANFNLKASEITTDIVYFIEDYLNELYIHEGAILDTRINVKVDSNDIIHDMKIRPLEITTVIDNFISNAEKAGAKTISFSFFMNGEHLSLEIEDDGSGIAEENIGEIFNFGFTTTEGSGIGLFQVKDIISSRMKGQIDVTSVMGKGTKFTILF